MLKSYKGDVFMRNPLTIHTDSSERLHYNIDDFSLYARKDFLSNYDYKALVHWHPDLEFIYIEKGTIDFYINGHIVRINQGDGIFVNSQRFHYGFSNQHNECIFIALVISADIFTHIISAAKEYMNLTFGLKNTNYICLYHHVQWQKNIIETVISIHNAMKTAVFRPLRIISLAIGLIDQIGEHIDDYLENEFDSH